MNRTASDTIAAVIQVLIFFLEDSFILLCVRILFNIIGNESGDKSNVTYNWPPQKSRFDKRGPQSSRFTNKGVRKAKSLGASVLENSTNLLYFKPGLLRRKMQSSTSSRSINSSKIKLVAIN